MNLRGCRIGGRLAALAAPVVLCALCAPAAAAERETYFAPSFSAAASFDDNIFNYKRVIATGGESQNFALQPGDIVVVP